MKSSIFGRVFSIAAENTPIPGCTVSGKMIEHGGAVITNFALARNTSISAERYPRTVLYIGASGKTRAEIQDSEESAREVVFGEGELLVVRSNVDVGFFAEEDSVYTETLIGKETNMNSVIKAGEVFQLKELVPYREGKIVNLDVIDDPSVKLVVMAFDDGCSLSEHAAPGEAVIFALDGEGVIGYNGRKHPIKAGENFVFAKGGLHSVEANGKFKMALLLTLGA